MSNGDEATCVQKLGSMTKQRGPRELPATTASHAAEHIKAQASRLELLQIQRIKDETEDDSKFIDIQ